MSRKQRWISFILVLVSVAFLGPALADIVDPYVLTDLDSSRYLGSYTLPYSINFSEGTDVRENEYLGTLVTMSSKSENEAEVIEVITDFKYERMRGTLVCTMMREQDSASIRIYADESLVFSQDGIGSAWAPLDFDIALDNCEYLRFEVLTTGNTLQGRTQIAIADCVLYNAGAEPTDQPSTQAEKIDLTTLGNYVLLSERSVVDSSNAWITGRSVTDARDNTYENALIIDRSTGYYKDIKERCSYAEFLVDGSYSRLCGKVVCSPEMKDGRPLALLIYGDNKLLYHSGWMYKRDKAIPFDIDISGVDSLIFYNMNDCSKGSSAYVVNTILIP